MKKLTLASRRELLTRVGAFALAPALSAGFSACEGANSLSSTLESN